MPTVVVPFRGSEGKSRLEGIRAKERTALAVAMLADVVEACVQVGTTFVVSPDAHAPEGAVRVHDPGGGHGAAVRAGLDAAVAAGAPGPYVVINADLPCVTPRDVFTLIGAVSDGGVAFASAADGTTNALALASPDLFQPLYGPGSAERFAALPSARAVDAPNLVDDVDTIDDLRRLGPRLGPRTRRVLARLRLLGAAA